MTRYAQLTRRGQIRRLREVAGKALTQYGIEPVSVSLLRHMYNTTFTVIGSDGSRYALNILRPVEDGSWESQRRTRVESELWWLDHVRTDLRLSVPIPVRTPRGAGAVVVPDTDMTMPRVCTLFRWVAGHFVRRRLVPAHLEAVGRLTARLHRDSENLHVPAWFDRPRVESADVGVEESIVRLFRDHVSGAAAEVMGDVFRRVRSAQADLSGGHDTYGLIHADIHQGNYLFRDGEVRLIDFGDCGWGHYLYDLAVTLSEISDLPRRAALRTALLKGYRTVRDLSPAHEALIDTFVLLREVQNLSWFLKARDDPSYAGSFAHLEAGVVKLEHLLVAGGSPRL